MLNYRAPKREFRFVLHELLAVSETLAAAVPGDSLAVELIDAVVDEAAKLCEEVLLPLNRVGDEVGCSLANGKVSLPPGFRPAFDRFVEGGWIGVSSDPEHGGQGLPLVINLILTEMMMATNLSFADYVGLPQAAAKTLSLHANEALRALYLPRIVAGEWGATMCMTEPQCGTDIGLVNTVALLQPDGSYRLTGTKIFISGGDHDLTPNIVHLVLARIEGAPAGVRGLSLFLCPKFIPDTGGALGARNSVNVVRLEKKMGYRAASTCGLFFDQAESWLVGDPNRGLNAMFAMVNVARLLVALQGLGTSEAAYQSAAAYAAQRTQGRALTGAAFPEQKADPLLVHPDVRRMLLSSRAFNEGGRALALWFGLQIDLADRHRDPAAREVAGDIVALLTPVIKAAFSDFGFESCNACMQIFGGHGYIRDNGMEQLVRDCRIAQIQEGANGVQAIDLIGRKLRMHDGRLWLRTRTMLEAFIADQKTVPQMAEFSAPLAEALILLSSATDTLRARIVDNPNEIGAAGTEYQRGFALVLFAWMWTWIASICLHKQDDPFYAAKLHVARYFFARELPKLPGHLAVAGAGADVLMAMPANQF